MEEYVTRIGDVTIQRVIPGGAGPNVEPVRVMESEELLRAVKQEPLDDDEEEEEEDLGEEEENIGISEVGEEERDEEPIKIKEEPRNDDDDDNKIDESEIQQDDERETKDGEEKEEEDGEESGGDEGEDNESSKRKADDDEDAESITKKKKMENEMEADKKKISNLRRNIREVMDEAQLDEATLAAQRQEAERLRRVQDQQKYLREVQRQIQLNKQNSKTQSRVISLLQGGSTSLLKTSAVSCSSSNNNSNAPSTVLVKLGSGQQQALNRKTLEVLRGGKTVTIAEPTRPGITRVTPGNKPAMVTPSVSIAPVKPIVPDGQKKDPSDADVVTISSSSDSEDDCILISEGEGEEEEEEEEMDTTNSGMHTNDLYNIPDEQGRVMINVGKPESEPEIYLAPQISRIIKPHQIGGVRFLFDNVVESIERFNTSTGFGCILAHSMGLGKTLQVVSFCDVFLRETSAKTVMCIMPINTLQNWMAEFNLWLPNDPTASPLAVHGEVRPRNFGIFVLNDMHKTIAARAKVVEEWNKDGGVLLIGYEMYRQLSLKRPGRLRKGKKRPPEEDVDDEKNKPLLEAMHEALVRPGPDLVICDEGHRIKNSHASISHALKQIRSKRRVVLTGYPLQNNLLEYWCMVDFVRPNYLGTKTEFSNMFERPIQNGQCIDSTPQDIRLMRYRAHVLHSLLEGFVQRRSHSVLRNTLPQKEEYVILVRMTSFQRKLYDTFMNEVVRTKAVPNPLKAFAVCCKIWNHPDILYNFIKKKELDELQDLDIEETANLHTGPNSPRRPLAPKEKKGKTVKKQAQIAAIKPEVAAPPQSQAVTPDMKTEERKFDFPQPPPQSGPTAGPPGYGDYYPPQSYSSDLSYPYHRPPAPNMYYPGYYQDNPGYYPGYESGGYPGYFSNFGPYASSKNEEFDKQSQSWGSNFSGNKEKNPSKSPKDFDSSKPGYQEFYPIKDEKTEIKEEKQFLCGFSGGQVSYNYRNFSGYSEYPYPVQDCPPGWNKGNFSNFSQGEPPLSGNRDKTGSISSESAGDPKSAFNNSSQLDSAHSQTIHNQNAPHGIHERNQSNQNINETHSLHSSSDQQRLHSSQEGFGGNQNLHATHDSLSTNRMSITANQVSDDQQRRSSQEHATGNQQGMFVNQRSDGSQEALSRNQENLMRNINSQESEMSRFHSNNHMHSGQQTLLNTHDQLQRTQSNIYGNKSSLDNDYRIPCNPDHLPGGQSMFSNMQSNKDYMPPNQSLNSRQNISESPRGQINQDQNLIHQQTNFNNQRPEHMMHGEHMLGVQGMSEAQPRIPNPQDRMSGNQSLFGSQEHQKSSRNLQNVHDTQHRVNSNQEHQSAIQQNMYGNQRSDHNMQTSQEHFSGSQHTMFGNQRSEHGLQEQILSNQKSGFGNQRGESNIQIGSDNMSSGSQNMYINPRNEHNLKSKQENVQNNPQNMYVTQRGEQNLPSNSEIMSHHNMCMNQRSESSGKMNPDHLLNSQQNLYGNQQRIEHNIQNKPEPISNMQQNIYNKSQVEYNSQRNAEQISSTSQDMYRTQRSELHLQSNVDNLSGSQQNMFANQRTDQGMQGTQDHMPFGHQSLAGIQKDNQRRIHMGPEHLTMSNNQNLFGGRSDHGPQPKQEQIQQSSLGNQEKDLQQRTMSTHDQQPGNQQMFGNPRNEIIGNPDRMHRHQESFIRNQSTHEIDSKLNNQGLKASSSQTMFSSQVIDHNVRNNPEKISQQIMTSIQERINQERFNSGLNRFGNQDSQTSMFRGKSNHDNSHKLHAQISQQSMYGNQEITSNPQNHHQATKRSSNSSDPLSMAQHRDSYGGQGNDHSMQKIMKTDNMTESQQMVHSVQEHSPSQFGIFADSDGQYRNCNTQEIQNVRTRGGDNQNSQESSHRMHMNRDRERHFGNQQHNPQDSKQSNHNFFSNQNVHDSQRWLHNNQELSASQQNMFDSHGALRTDDPFLVNQNLLGNQQKFHNTQEPISLPQQNIFMVSGNLRQEHMKQQNVVGTQSVQDNQYRLSSNQDVHIQEQQQNTTNAHERQGLHNNPDAVHGNPQNVMSRKSIPDHGLDHQTKQGMTSNSGVFGNQLQCNIQGEMRGNSEQIVTQHSSMGNLMAGKHGSQSNQEFVLNNQCGSVQNIPGSNTANINSKQSGSNINQTHGVQGSQHAGSIHNQEMLKTNQNMSGCQNYGLPNAPSQSTGREHHQSNQTGALAAMPRQQQLGAMNPQEIQKGGTNENNSGNQHSSYVSQYQISGSQQNIQCFPNQTHHIQGNQQGISACNPNSSMFGNQHMSQGSIQNISGGGQGHLGNQTHVQNNQHQFIGSQTAVHPQMQNKDIPPGTQGSSYGGNPGQYMAPTSQQNVPVSSHTLHGDHFQNSKHNINAHINIPVSQHNVQSQHNSGSSQQTATINKTEHQKTQGSPQSLQHKTKSNQNLSVNQQGTQTVPEHSSQLTGTQHRVQNMLGQTGLSSHQQSQNSFDQTIIMSSKGMSGGQMVQGSQQLKLGMQNTSGSPEDQNRFKGQFDEQFLNDRFQGNFSKTGFFGQDFQFYQNQFPFQDNQFNEQPGPSGQKFRKEDDKPDEGKSKEVEKKQKDNEEGKEGTKTCTSSTNTEKEDEKDKKEKKDEDDKAEKKEGTTKTGKEDPGIPYDWATEFLKGYMPGDINASAKMAVFFCILEESIALGDRILVFSQSLFTLNLMEELLQQQFVPGREERWARNVNYFRLDGSTTAMEREKLINEFNSNINLHLFLVSTRAGSLGINLVGANRVIVFDASWNPCHDTQAVCRVYRYGQKKPCFVYRLVTDNCLEKKIYDRQINKQGMSDRVVDECNPDAHLSIKEVTSLCWDDKTDDDAPKDFSSLQDSYIDVVLQKVIQKHSNLLSKEPFQHESLLVDRKEKKLSQAEKRLAKRSYELEKQATTRPVYNGVQPNQVRPKPMASVRPMQAEMGQTRQRGWIPASVWQRQGMSAQEMTLPLDVVIPTNAADRASIVLKAGQKVMVLKSPKGIYMQLENGKIIAIRTAFKVGANKKPGEQQGKGDSGRRGGRQQIISPRGRPVRAVGPVSRPPPVTVTVTRKRPPEDEPPPAQREEDTPSSAQPPTAPVTPMEVSTGEKDAPNPFTAAAAASLSSMQLPQQQNSQSSVTQQTQQSSTQPSTAPAPIQPSQVVQQSEQAAHPQPQSPLIQPQQSNPHAQFPSQPIQPTQHLQQPVSQSQQGVSQAQHSQQQPIPPLPKSISSPQQQSLPSQQQPVTTQQQSLAPQQKPISPQQQPISPQQQPIAPQSKAISPKQQPIPPQQQLIQPQQISQQTISSQQITQQQHSQQSVQPTHLSQQNQPLGQPQHSHQTVAHSQLGQHHALSLPQLPSQPQPLPPHQFPLKPIAPHSQLPPQPGHIPHSLSHSPLSQQTMPHPQLPIQPIITHPQLVQASHPLSQPHHLPPTHLQMHPMPHSQLHSLPIPPLSQMHQSMTSHSQIPSQALPPHPQILPHMQQSLPQPQFPQQSMLHPQVQHPQHYEPPPIPPLVGDQLT